MIKSVKRLGAAVLSAVMMLTAVATPLGDNLPAVRESTSLTAGAVSEIDKAGVLDRISQLKSLFPDGSYFSVNGKACNSSNASTHNCSNCRLGDILSKNSKAHGTIVPSVCNRGGCYTCLAFARFSFCFIFGHDTNTNITEIDSKNYGGICDSFVSKLKPGDYLECFRNGTFVHAAIYLGCDLNKDLFYVYESNYGNKVNEPGQTNKVRYNNSRKYSRYDRILVTRSKSYVDTIDLKSTPSDIGSEFESVIRCTSTGKVLSAGSDNNVTAVSYNGSNNQLWKFYKNSDNYYKIVNVGTGKRLDVNNAGTADGTNIQVWTDNDSSAQRWGVYGSQGSYLLKPKYSTSSVLDSGGGNNNVHLWTYASNIAAQKFTIEKMPSTWFSDVTAKNIKTNDARIALYANKPASAKATKYSIEVWQTNNSSNKKSYSFTPSGNYPNEGVESKQIYFDMIAEVGFTLSSATQYSYKITQYFTYLGASMSRTSGTYSFTTLASSSHTHSYGSWYTKTSATCTSGGTEERKCSCGATESRSTSALGHNYGSWSTVTNATCTSGGSEKRTCSRCSNSETRSTSALGHNYGSTYFEAYHPHKYAHLCQRCGYKEFTGGNLDYYEKCDTCYNENLPGKPYLNISSNGFTESDTVSFTWDPTDKTTHYNLTVAVLSDGEYKTVCRQTYVNSGFQATFGKGQYRVVLDSYNSNMFHQYTDDWRDWIHNSSDYVYFDIDCAHEYESTIVKPTFTEKGYTLHTCTKCGYSYKDNYTPALKPTELTGVKVKTQGTASLTLAWDKNANAKGYIIEQYKGGKWTQVAKTSNNAAVTYTVNGLAADTTYTFRIKAYAISGESEIYSDYVRIAGKTRIANVASFKGSAVSASAVKLDWSKNDKATGYVIEQYKGGKWTALATTKNNTTLTFTVKGLAEGTTYSFRIKSYRKTGSTTDFSEYTAIKAATLLDGVSDLKVTSVTGSWITLEWAKNDKATGYSIEQYKGGKWTVIATTKNNTTLKFTVKGLKNDTTYSFRIRTYKTAGASNVYSDYVRIAGKTRIPNVATFTGSAVSASAVKLDWSKNDKAIGYVIERYKGGKWTAITTTKNNTTLTFTVKGLAKGTTYSFRIKSFRKTGSTTEFSEYASVKVKTAE